MSMSYPVGKAQGNGPGKQQNCQGHQENFGYRVFSDQVVKIFKKATHMCYLNLSAENKSTYNSPQRFSIGT